jgi:hypothetical protein
MHSDDAQVVRLPDSTDRSMRVCTRACAEAMF